MSVRRFHATVVGLVLWGLLSAGRCEDAEKSSGDGSEPDLGQGESPNDGGATDGDNGQNGGPTSETSDSDGGADALANRVAAGALDPRRSLAITDQPILERFPLKRVLDQLVAQSDIQGFDAVELFQQWWDTNNPGPGLGLGPNCDSERHPVYGPSINDFPFDCRPTPAEGAQASCDPFVDDACRYIPIGLFNRFDLAPVDGSHCGEYRIVYAKVSGPVGNRDRNLIIFEAILPNPKPTQGVKGCRQIVTAWADLSKEDDIGARADWLESFYFGGRGNIEPVVHINHYGDNAMGAGQIRTNQFMQPQEEVRKWSLREFKLRKSCAGGGCKLQMLPVTVKTNPFGPLFDPGSVDGRAASFRNDFVATAVDALAKDELSAISFQVQDTFNAPQSHSSGSLENDYLFHFGTEESALRDGIQARLDALGSALTPDNIVARALTQSCAGCHRLSRSANLGGGLTWPEPLGFVHVSEVDPETVDGVLRFRLSPALLENFLPVRLQLMADYLNEVPGKYKGKTLGGRTTH